MLLCARTIWISVEWTNAQQRAARTLLETKAESSLDRAASRRTMSANDSRDARACRDRACLRQRGCTMLRSIRLSVLQLALGESWIAWSVKARDMHMPES